MLKNLMNGIMTQWFLKRWNFLRTYLWWAWCAGCGINSCCTIGGISHCSCFNNNFRLHNYLMRRMARTRFFCYCWQWWVWGIHFRLSSTFERSSMSHSLHYRWSFRGWCCYPIRIFNWTNLKMISYVILINLDIFMILVTCRTKSREDKILKQVRP